MRYVHTRLLLACAATVIAGCGASGGPPGLTTGDGGSESPPTRCGCDVDDECGLNTCGAECGSCAAGAVCLGGHCAPASACDRTGFAPFIAQASLVRVEGEGATVEWRADSRATQPFERLVLQSFERLGGPTTPGTYALTDAGYADCGLCALAYQGCTQAGCARMFLADAGTVAIDALGDGRMAASLRDARFREVYLNEATLDTVSVPDGETWCVERLDIDTALAEEHLDDTCVADGTGTRVGDKIADIPLSTCDGRPTSLHALCGARAVWVVLATGWCSACAAHVPEVGAAWEAQHELGLEALTVLGEDAAGEHPTPAYCQQYAAEMGVDPSLVYIPARGFETISDHIELYSDGTLGLPWDGVLDGRNMRYVWAQTHDGGAPAAAVGALLGK